LDNLNSPILDRVRAIASCYSGLPLEKLSSRTAVDQDLNICGDDVADLAEALAKKFGEQVRQWPSQRFADLNEGVNPFVMFWLVWRLMTWPVQGRMFDPSPFERLELGHIAAVVDRGKWFDP